MPRISLLTTGLAIGGAETQIVMLAKALKGLGWQVEVISMLPPVALADGLERDSIPVTDLGMTRGRPDPRAVWRLAAHLRKSRPHVLHTHMVHANLLGRAVRPLCRIPVVINTAHSIQEGGFWRELGYRLTDPFCDLVTQVSEAGAKRYSTARISGPQKTIWIPNAVDLNAYRIDPQAREQVRKQLSWQDAFVWIAVGNLREPKNYPNLLEAFTLLRDTHPRARLAIAGAGVLEKQLRELAAQRVIANDVDFLGLRTDVARLLAGADAYVISSDFEGTPMALLEAAAARLPLVATDVGGNRDVIATRSCGHLVPPRDPARLAAAMSDVMRFGEQARQEMGQAARMRVEKHFGLEAIVAKWDNVYRQLLAARALESRSHGRRLPFLKSRSEAG